MLRLPLLAVLLARCGGWVTISQSRFGAQVDTIRDLMHIPEANISWHWPNRHLPDQRARTRLTDRTRRRRPPPSSSHGAQIAHILA